MLYLKKILNNIPSFSVSNFNDFPEKSTPLEVLFGSFNAELIAFKSNDMFDAIIYFKTVITTETTTSTDFLFNFRLRFFVCKKTVKLKTKCQS